MSSPEVHCCSLQQKKGKSFSSTDSIAGLDNKSF